MIDLQFGDIANRLRRFTRSVGSIPVQLLEQAQLSVALQDLSLDPYATEPRKGTLLYTTGPAAAQSSFAAIQAFPGTVLCIDALWIQSTTAQETVNVFLDRDVPFPSSVYTLARLSPVGLNTPVVPGPSIHLAPVLNATIQGANTFVNPPTGTLLMSLVNAAGTIGLTQYQLPYPIVLYGNLPQNQPATAIGVGNTGDLLIVGSNGTLNVGIGVQFWVREFSLLQGFR